MKKKVTALTLFGLLCLSAAVSAGSLWGSYKGFNIIRVTVDGQPVLSSSGVPAVAMDGNTMVPVSVLSKAGVGVNWDSKDKTVQITSDQASITHQNTFDMEQIYKSLVEYGVTSVKTEFGQKGAFTSIEFTGDSKSITNDQLTNIVSAGANAPTTYYIINFSSGEYYAFLTSDVNDWYEGKLSGQQLMNKVIAYTKDSSQTSTATTSQPTTSYDPAVCQKIKDDANRRGGLDSGGVQYQLQMAGCPAN